MFFEPFVKKLRKTRPNIPIILAEDSNRGGVQTAKGIALRAIFDKLKDDKVTNLHYLSNRSMLGKDFEGTVDGCHHNDLGMMSQPLCGVLHHYLDSLPS